MRKDAEGTVDELPESTRRVVAQLRHASPPPDLLGAVLREARGTAQVRQRQGLPVPLSVYGLAAAAVIAAIVLLPRVPAFAPGATGPSGLPLGGSVELRVPVPAGAHPGSADVDSVWLGSEATGEVLRVDARTGEIVGRVQVNDPTSEPYDLWPVSDGASVWASGRDDRSVVRIDIASLQVAERWPVDAVGYRILPDGDVLWVSDFDGGRVLEVDATDGRVLGSVPIGRPTGLAMSGSTLWVVDYVGDVYEVDPRARTVVARHDVATRATDLLAVDDALLVWGLDGRPLERFDTLTDAVVRSRDGITAVATVGGEMWAAWDIGAVVRIDPVTLEFLAAVPLGAGATDQLVASARRLWAYRGTADGTFIEAVRPQP